ncbi:NmrA family NAD(P)-binding protein [Amycolatopsis acidiphila]|uniref:NAD-dependent epimerase/dehydratase family protein n=1 Tax=Amycolatopsis acidiphila TaxID=715473 RepID=A0A558AIM0_9PSEU|nr:NmrA family NAD(P)-binding protein [Amycolatopsis acidiphila]TVT24115.1 NAD-dependent epimerase/dehydratase family protein [Amycolatopsis acidiphila]UIJ57723.1 NmrA family NAD(P)-binding protein [Amycolatopsis acidiphila]GHG87305.1 hypothetical protein GCM10017788_60830 [Amycolatopsis acidiphila]
MKHIVVVGASGIAGRHLLRELCTRDVEVVAISHSVEGEAALQTAGVPVVRAGLDDISALRSAFSGAHAVYAIPPALHPREDELIVNAVRAAAEAGARRFVYHSVLHPCTPTLRNHLRKARAEAAVRESSPAWTILQPSLYAQVVLAMFADAAPGAARVPFDRDAKLAVLDLADLAEVGARVATEDGHEYATYELAGPLTTMAQMVAAVGARRGVRLRAESGSPLAAPLPPAARHHPMAGADMISTFAHYDTHGFPGNPRVLTLLLGREPATFDQVAARDLR